VARDANVTFHNLDTLDAGEFNGALPTFSLSDTLSRLVEERASVCLLDGKTDFWLLSHTVLCPSALVKMAVFAELLAGMGSAVHGK
jgi:hypothetical protein